MTTADVKRFLDDLTGEVRPIVNALRGTIRKSARQVDETLLWGGPSYHRPGVGGRVKGAVCQITVKAGKVRLEFIHRVYLSDQDGLLWGERVSKRYVFISTVEDARNSRIGVLISESARFDVVNAVARVQSRRA